MVAVAVDVDRARARVRVRARAMVRAMVRVLVALFDQISHYHYYYNTTNGSEVASFPSPPMDKQQIKLHTHLFHPFKSFLIKFPPQYRSLPSCFSPTTTESRTTEIVTPSLVHLSLNFRATQ